MTKQEVHALKQSIRSTIKFLSKELDLVKDINALLHLDKELNNIKSNLGEVLVVQHLKEVESLRVQFDVPTDSQE